MVQLGRFNQLQVVKRSKIGLFLDAGNYGEILLPRKYADDNLVPGNLIDVFVYRDSEDRVVATTLQPKAQVGECAYLKVIGVNRIGAFLNWGLPKDLLVPFSEQEKPMKKGYSYAVFVYLDDSSQRIVASSRLEQHLGFESADFKPRQAVDLLIYARSDLGYKAIINHQHLGQLYANETFRRLHFGEQVTGYIKQVRKDGKIDLSLQLPSHLERDKLSAAIIEHLHQNGGRSVLTDKSPPDEIYQAFGVSKANYKKALGQLYKRRAIDIEDDSIRLL